MESQMGAKPTADATPELAPQDEAPVDLIEISGVIKWFDVAKGYGFIVPDNGMPDVLLHVTCLRRDGFQTAYEGARIVADNVWSALKPIAEAQAHRGRPGS